MLEAAIYALSSFWFGALHAAAPGHGKTVAAAYLVGARGRLVDAVTLGLVVTLSHTLGIILFAVVATLGSAATLPRVLEQYVALGTALLIVSLGSGMLLSQRHWLLPRPAQAPAGDSGESLHVTHGWHRHGLWGHRHSHSDLSSIASRRPSLSLLVGLGIAGGVMPDPGALAVLLSALSSGRLVLGLVTVLVFSLGFATVLVLAGMVAGRAGVLVLGRWTARRGVEWLQFASSLVITGYGVVLFVAALRMTASLT